VIVVFGVTLSRDTPGVSRDNVTLDEGGAVVEGCPPRRAEQGPSYSTSPRCRVRWRPCSAP
jgi:hypothetical protein